MRVIAGALRGRKLEAPVGISTRPTSDRAREALFSMLASRLGTFDELHVADLFAGSGALGLEALSRGAANATFVEQDPKALAALRRNAENLQLSDRTRILATSAMALPRAGPFDLILGDPPYGPGSGTRLVATVRDAGWLAPGGWLAVETERNDAVDPAGWTIDTERQFGKARITLISAP